MSEAEVIQKFPRAPVTGDTLDRELRRLGLHAGTTVIVHSSLSSLGWVCGGAVPIVQAIMDIVRPFGNVVMPTHTNHLSDPAGWDNPPVPAGWWEIIRKEMPPFIPDTTPSRGMGAVPELFRTMPHVIRSNHPHFSFAAWGERSIEITAEHSLDFGLGDGSPLARVYDLDGQVLLLGVGFDRNTSFHLSEHRSEFPGKEITERMAPMLINGHRRWKQYQDVNIDSGDFAALGRDFLDANEQAIRVGTVGNATCHLFPQRLAVDFGIDWFRRKRR